MDESLRNAYIERFDRHFSLLKNKGETSYWVIELTEEDLQEHNENIAERVLHDDVDVDGVFRVGTFISYGYRVGAFRQKGINKCYTRQGGYHDNAVWKYDLNGVLDECEEVDNPDTAASRIIQWTIDPGSNIENSDAIIGKMIRPIMKNLLKITPPGKRTDCTVVLPPFSGDIEIRDWKKILGRMTETDLQVKITNYGHLLKIEEDERQYIIIYQTDGYKEFVIISAYELIRGHNACIGSLAYDISDGDKCYQLKDVKPVSVTVDFQEEIFSKKEQDIELDWKYLKCKYPVNEGFVSFLSKNPVSFGRELYKRNNSDIEGDDDRGEVINVFAGNKALDVYEVCGILQNETNLYNVSLGDLVYVASFLQNSKKVNKVSVKTSSKFKLGTSTELPVQVDMNKLPLIPCNYGSFSWRIKDKQKRIVPYSEIKIENHNEIQIIESIIEHFDHCTTDIIADELLYMYKKAVEPSAFFAAKVFIFLSQIKSIEIESRNYYITDFDNVDSVEYEEIDKSGIKESRSKKKKCVGYKEKKKNGPNSYKSIPVDKAGFSMRTYASLNKAGIKTIGDLTRKRYRDLFKIKSLNYECRMEITNKLEKMGLKLVDQ